MGEKQAKIKKKKFSEIGLLIPIFFAVVIIPMIVRVIFYDPKLSQYNWFAESTSLFDIHMYYKNRAMMLLDGVLAVLLAVLLVRKKLPKEKAFVPLAIYLLFVIASSVFSIAPAQTWFGFYDVQESAFALIGYCMICYYVFAVAHTEKQIKMIVYAVFIGIFLMSLVGMSQFIGHDFYATDLGKALTIPAKYFSRMNMDFEQESRQVNATFNNPNYVGVYACLMVPFLLVFAFSMQDKRYIPVYAVLAVLLLATWAGSGSKTAVLTIIPCMVFAAIFFGKRHWKKMIPVYLVSIVVFTVFNIYASRSVVQDAFDRVVTGYKEFETYRLTDISLHDEDFTVTYDDAVLTVRYYRDDAGDLDMKVTENGAELPLALTEEKNGYCVADPRFEELQFIYSVDNKMREGFSVTSQKNSFFIYYDENQKTYYYLNYYGRVAKMISSETIDSPLFHLMGGFSGRGYIWSKSLPALKETILFGSGPDTFPFMFPQYDYVSLIQNGWKTAIIVKPHNIYLQIAIQTGVVSLIAMLVFYLRYFVASIRLYRKRTLTTFAERTGVAIFLASIGFMIAGFLNDSTVGVSVVYWTLLGGGFACNRVVGKNKKS